MKNLTRAIVLATIGALLLIAASPTIIDRVSKWPPQAGTPYGFGGPYEVASQAVPTSTTAVTTVNSRIIGYCVTNTTAGALTFTMATGQASPVTLPGTQSVAANSYKCDNWPFGVYATTGFTVIAGGAGLTYSVVWTH